MHPICQRVVLGKAVQDDHDVSHEIVVLDGVLYNVKQNQLVLLPVHEYLTIEVVLSGEEDPEFLLLNHRYDRVEDLL
jgi:hypothetical protein